MLPAIVIVAYNRPLALTRILNSIASANYEGYSGINLIISIDGGGSNEVAAIAQKFEWKRGQKSVLNHKENLGLRKHILSCGDLSEKYGAVIILEDDNFVSSGFYRFAAAASSYYDSDSRIAGISLFLYPYNEFAVMPFIPIHDGNDVFFMQLPTSLGQVWTWNQWKGFRTWYDKGATVSLNDRLPEKVKKWPESSWKKYFYKYLLEHNLFFVYPSVSHLTNFGDTGTHYDIGTTVWQAALEQRTIAHPFALIPFEESNNKYDGFFEMLPACLQYYGVEIPDDCIVDLGGSKQLALFDGNMVLSSKESRNPQRMYGADLIPPAMNIIHNVPGKIFSYADKKQFKEITTLTRDTISVNMQPIGFRLGIYYHTIRTNKEYKTGYYVRHPFKIIDFILRKLFRK